MIISRFLAGVFTEQVPGLSALILVIRFPWN